MKSKLNLTERPNIWEEQLIRFYCYHRLCLSRVLLQIPLKMYCIICRRLGSLRTNSHSSRSASSLTQPICSNILEASISSAQSSVMEDMYKHFVNALGRPKMGLDHHCAVPNPLLKPLVKSARIMGTDRWVPLSDIVRQRYPQPDKKSDVFCGKILNRIRPLVTRDSNRPVDISYEYESTEKCNTISVRDALSYLPSSLPLDYKMDLLRVYLTSSEMRTDYFIPELFSKSASESIYSIILS